MKKRYDYTEWETIVEPIITSKWYFKRHTFKHHDDMSVYDHCVAVSKLSYRMAKFFHTNYRDAAIAGILHDFYTTPWMNDHTKRPLLKRHGFIHAQIALDNSRKYFPKYLNPKIENAIQRHMFPLNKVPPKYTVGYIVTVCDKISSLNMLVSGNFIKRTFFGYPKKP